MNEIQKPCFRCGELMTGPVDLDGKWQHLKCRASAAHDPVYNPNHYVNHPSGVEPIVIAEAMGFCLGNVIKYVMRADLKGDPVQDLKKAAFYLDREIARREKDGDQ